MLEIFKKKVIFHISTLQREGISGGIERIRRKLFNVQSKEFIKISSYFNKSIGLEIGGASSIFEDDGLLPIYPLLKSLDGCNFSNSTVWEGSISEGNSYKFNNRLGYQYISDATDLSKIQSEKYEIVISNHCLEHVANPIKALTEWKRVLKNGGYLLVIVPDKRYTFDYRRPVTKLGHLIDDYEKNISEDDLTHAEETINLHDANLDVLTPITKELFKERVMKNFENRCIHHHVFSSEMLAELFEYMGFEIVHSFEEKPCHLGIIGRKISN